ncbi:TonB-dependent receptor [Pseudoduganella namucuonensis]|uniref:TonB-dependent receptor n=1 Tax=Pseudoduganella namucuonensis TaxID=1035707 RepID=A0A1I7K2I2_9BURK|nr:TonB-dependent receptor [Pseudoduganella namucuonensis]SFU91565.1 TonB-dependent receptor [Pseudoduganella namucuonensis]
MSERFNAARSGIRLNSGALLVIASLLAAQGAAAQETQAQAAQEAKPAAAAPASQDNVVMVVGTRKSVASAIDRKIRNATVSDSLVAEDINQFPDKNVGEALSRITGVQLSREFGEGSQVSIRGVEPDLNRIEINGMSVLGTNGGAGRGAELRELASELIASIDVYKGVTADMTEGGVGGTVSIKTRKPLDFKKPTVATTVSAEQSSSRGGVQPRVSLLLADKYLDGKLGLMANIVYDKVFTRNDYARNTSWRFLRDWDGSAEKTITSRDPVAAAITSQAGCGASTLTAAQRTACQQQWFDYNPGISRYGIWTRDHERSSAELTAQYKFSNELSAWASYQANTQDQRLNDRNFGTSFENVNRLANAGNAPVYNQATAVQSAAGTCVAAPTTGLPAGMVVENHYVTQFTAGNCLNLAGQGGQGAFSTQARDFALNIESKYASGGFNYKKDNLELEGLLVKSSSDYSSNSNSVVATQNAPGLVVNLDKQGLPHFTFPSAYSPDSPSSYTQVQLQYRPSETKNTEDQFKLDGKYRVDQGILTKLWFGGQMRKSTAKQYNGGGYLASNGANLASTADDVSVLTANVNQTLVYDPLYTGGAQRAADGQSYLNSSFSTKYTNAAGMAQLISAISGRSPGTFFDGYDKVSGMPAGWMSPSYAAAAPFFDTSKFNHDSLYQALGSDGKMYQQLPAFAADERVRSGYARLDWESEVFGLGVSGNVGARYTNTRNTATGSYRNQVRVANQPGSSTFTDYIISNEVLSLNNSYHDVLPSANAMMWVVPDALLVRVGWAKVMARPRIDLLAPNATCTLNSGSVQFGGDGSDDCTAGNPDLKPFRATNTDLSVEYYPSQDSQISMALFGKDISSYILERTLVKGVNLFKDGRLWDVTQPINGRGAKTKGIELTARTAFTFLPGWLGGFGGDVNYTRMTYKYAPGTERLNILDGSVLPYPGLSKNSYNVGLWYDLDKVNARIAYNYRDRYYTGGNDVSGNPNFTEKTGFLDAKFQYRLDKNWTFSIEGKNLTDQAQITDAGDLFRVNELAWSGRRYFLSVSYKN